MTKLLPFDLEAAKAGAKVVTRDGRPARIVCWDRVGCAPLMALVMNQLGDLESPCFYTRDGVCFAFNNPCSAQVDLFMAPTPVKRWRVIYRDDENCAAQRDFETFENAAIFRNHNPGSMMFEVEVTP